MSRSDRSSIVQKSTLLSGACVAAIAFMPAIAQTSAESDDTDARRLTTVTVTATKREQTLQEVPVAVSVVDESVIADAEVQDLGDLQSLVPSLRVGQLQSSANTNFVIRGFGNGANNAGIEPSVGVFIDGVYRSRSAAQIADLPNLQRVEVLRGPQSTLFGKNASAGVISIVTQAPQFEQSGSVEASVGNFNAVRLKGDITGPITDKLAYSLAANLNQRDGYADDLNTGDDVNQRDRYGLRGQLLFEPNDRLQLRAIADFDKIDEICCTAGNLFNGPTGDAIFALGGALDPENPFSYNVFNNFASENDIENAGISLQGDYETDFATFTSITAFRRSDLIQNADSDFTSADLVGRNFNETEIETFTQEFRITSVPGDSPLNWMVGGFYFDETVDISNEFFYGEDFRNYGSILAVQLGAAAIGQPVPAASDVLAGLNAGVIESAYESVELALGVPVGSFIQPGQGFTESFGQDNQSWSIFGTLDYDLTDRLTATLGLNYTSDEKEAFGQIASTDAFSALDFVDIGIVQGLQAGGFMGDPTDPVAIGTFIQANPLVYDAALAGATNPATNPLLGLTALQFLPPFVNFPNAVESGETDDEDVSYTFRLAYDVSDNVSVYGSWATGFKASSWNLSRDSRPFAADFIPGAALTFPDASPIRDAGLAVPNLTATTRFAGPEESEVFEIGLKAAFDRLAFNVTVFDQTIEGFQSNVFTGTGFRLANSGEQSTVGLEFDSTWQATDQLTLGFAATLLDPTYDSFVDSATGDISGTQPAAIPEQAFSTSAKYDFALGDFDAFVRADWQYESETDYFDAIEPGSDFVDAQAILGFGREINTVNASTGLVTPNGLGITLWGRNIFDDEYITTAFASVAQEGSISGYPNQPATYGVTVRKEF